MSKSKLLWAIFLISHCSEAFSMSYYLQQDLGVRDGIYRLCKYTNGRVYSFNAVELCPLSIDDDVSGPAPTISKRMGFKTGEQIDGLTKVCFYDVLGSEAAIRIGVAELCPLTHEF